MEKRLKNIHGNDMEEQGRVNPTGSAEKWIEEQPNTLKDRSKQ